MNKKKPAAARISPQTKPRGPAEVLILAGLLAVITIAVFWGVRGNGFVNFDDNVYVTDNWHVRQGLSLESVKWAFGSEHAHNWHPLTWLSHMADVQLFGMDARAQHLMNLGIHAASTLLLFGILVYTTGRRWASWLVAALFAIHPLHVESVAWIAERKDVLSGFFWMATMWMYASYARRPGLPRYLGVLALFGLGLMAKPMLVTLPLVLLLLDYWPLGRSDGTALLREKRAAAEGRATAFRLIVEKLPLLAMVAISCIMTIRAQHIAIANMESLSPTVRLTNAVVSYGRYLYSAAWPAGLAIFYPHPRVAQYWPAALVLAGLVATTVLVLRFGKDRRYLVTGWLWYLLTLIPVIGLVQVGDQSHADRYTYLSLTGIFIALVWLVADTVAGNRALRYAAVVCAAVAMSLLAVATMTCLRYWKDTESLCRRAISVTSGNYLMKTNLALELFAQGKVTEAEQQIAESLQIRPGIPQSLSTMGIVLSKEGKYEEALKYYSAALAKSPNQKELYFNIAAAYLAMGRPADAVPYSKRATELDPNWGKAFLQLSIALNDAGRVPEAAVALARSKQLGVK